MTEQNHAPYVFAETYTKRFVMCPICKDEHEKFYVDHLLKDAKPDSPFEVGPWQCKGCNNFFMLKVHLEGPVEIAQWTKRREPYLPCLVLLKSTHEKDPIYIMIKSGTHNDQLVQEKAEQGSSLQPFFYNENTCPTNYLSNTIAIAFDGDSDPHGVFEFVRLLSIPDAAAIAKANGVEVNDYNGIDEADIESTFEDHMALLFPECVSSGNDYEGSLIDPQLLISN